MPTEPEYNERTCVTAGELRAAGFTIPESVPDCGWIRRSSLVFGASAASGDDEGRISVPINVDFLEPFRWISLSVEIDGGSA